MISVSEQDYIKAVYRLEQQFGNVNTTALAAELNVTAASASGMLKKLSQANLVSHHHYRGARLTEKGRNVALDVIRRHRIIELFLVEILRLGWDEVHKEAEVLEHAVSDKVLAGMDRLLGRPTRDPHGSPIPSSDGYLARQATVRLDEMEVGSSGVVAEITEDNADLLQYLSRLRLVPGTRIAVCQVSPIDAMITIACGQTEMNVSPKVASAIRVSLRKRSNKK